MTEIKTANSVESGEESETEKRPSEDNATHERDEYLRNFLNPMSPPVPVPLEAVATNSNSAGFPAAIKSESDTGFIVPSVAKRKKVEYKAPDKGPRFYNSTGNLTTAAIIPEKLAEAFNDFPVLGKPVMKADLESFYTEKIRNFVGSDLNDAEFENLAEYCSPNNLKNGREMVMESKLPTQGQDLKKIEENDSEIMVDENSLCILKKYKLRVMRDVPMYYSRRLKYRGVKLWPLANENEDETIGTGKRLEPGKDVIFKIRTFRTLSCTAKFRISKIRHSVLNKEIVVCGNTRLRELRTRIICPNDIGSRTDVSDNPDLQPTLSAKDMFPSGFLFINNVFYVDCREGCIDYSAPIRQWAESKGMGKFTVKDMDEIRFQDLNIKLGYPEVYVHQGDCEHLFTFSEIRLVHASDPLNSSFYPILTASCKNHTVYCTSCAEFGAKWVVTDCPKVPFDPAFFCEVCFDMYLYKDKKKICDFKAYSFKGNEINTLKPIG